MLAGSTCGGSAAPIENLTVRNPYHSFSRGRSGGVLFVTVAI